MLNKKGIARLKKNVNYFFRNAPKKLLKLFLFKAVYPLCYKLFCIRRSDPEFILFCEVRHGYLTDSFRPIVKELKKRGANVGIFYIHNNSGGLSYLLRYLRLCMILPSAGTIFIDDTCNLFGAFRFRQGTKLIQTWHSCGAFKKWGYSIAGLSFGQEPSELDRYPAHCNYSLVTVSSAECIPHFNEAFGFSGRSCVKATGIARTDYYFDGNNKRAAFERLYEICPEARGKKTVLYAPTYRGDADNASAPELPDFGGITSGITDIVILVKQHGFVKNRPALCDNCAAQVFDVSDSLKIEELLFVSDVCITDYSSLIFEYSLFLKPMIFYAPDLGDFYDYRGFYYPYDESFLPGDIALNEAELKDCLETAVKGNYDKKKIEEFKDKFMGACDGHSTERIADFAQGKS